ncbi:myosin heavy chain, fast skeletal muscle-like [Malaya genurostris]|uniref:myosin heavy chain, fast skeletal muscle-like n=1 Tax=Malaya genurostris TaxID=325434 RepID=UPI0026F3C226|nr:myosin heavy chain, fast skeletal muscle-like [Malaya genurostris]
MCHTSKMMESPCEIETDEQVNKQNIVANALLVDPVKLEAEIAVSQQILEDHLHEATSSEKYIYKKTGTTQTETEPKDDQSVCDDNDNIRPKPHEFEKQCNSEILNIIIENDEEDRTNKLWEKDKITKTIIRKNCINKNEETLELENKVLELSQQVDVERSRVQKLVKNLKDKKQRLDKRTAEYNELSAQLVDSMQDTDAYKERIETLERSLQLSAASQDKLLTDLEAIKQNSDKSLQAQSEQSQILQAQLGEAREQILHLESQNQRLCMNNSEQRSTVYILKKQAQLDDRKINENVQHVKEDVCDEHKSLVVDHCTSMHTMKAYCLKVVPSGRSAVDDNKLDPLKEQELIKHRNGKQTYAYSKISEQSVENFKSSDYCKENNKNPETLLQHCTTSEAKLLPDSERHLKYSDEVLQISNAQLKETEEQIVYLQLQDQKLSSMASKNESAAIPGNEGFRFVDVQVYGEKEALDELTLLREENRDLTIAVEELSMKIVSLEHQIVKAEGHDDHLDDDALDAIISKRLNTLSKQLSESTLDFDSKEITISMNGTVKEDEMFHSLHEDQFEGRNPLKLLDEKLTVRGKSIQEIDEIYRNREKLLAKLLSLENDMEESANIREHLEKEVRALKVDLGDLDQQLKELNGKVENLTKKNDKYKQQLKMKTDEIKCSTFELIEARKSIKSLKQENGQLLQKINSAESQNTNLTKTVKEYKSVITEQALKLEEKVSLEPRLRYRLEEAEKIKATLEQELKNLQAKYRTEPETDCDFTISQQRSRIKFENNEIKMNKVEPKLIVEIKDSLDDVSHQQLKYTKKEKPITELSECFSKLERVKTSLQQQLKVTQIEPLITEKKIESRNQTPSTQLTDEGISNSSQFLEIFDSKLSFPVNVDHPKTQHCESVKSQQIKQQNKHNMDCIRKYVNRKQKSWRRNEHDSQRNLLSET